jgi:hypothetical protein
MRGMTFLLRVFYNPIRKKTMWKYKNKVLTAKSEEQTFLLSPKLVLNGVLDQEITLFCSRERLKGLNF